ncbi:unnamed protein product [Discula destructiva]
MCSWWHPLNSAAIENQSPLPTSTRAKYNFVQSRFDHAQRPNTTHAAPPRLDLESQLEVVNRHDEIPDQGFLLASRLVCTQAQPERYRARHENVTSTRQAQYETLFPAATRIAASDPIQSGRMEECHKRNQTVPRYSTIPSLLS